jgi:hypothetical protein
MSGFRGATVVVSAGTGAVFAGAVSAGVLVSGGGKDGSPTSALTIDETASIKTPKINNFFTIVLYSLESKPYIDGCRAYIFYGITSISQPYRIIGKTKTGRKYRSI